ncbi:MAG: hypothetical protein ACK559_13045, partial [bacterium]
EVGPAERGSGPDGKAFRPGAGERWVCPVNMCRDSATHPLDECGGFKSLSVPQRRKAIKEWNRCECCLMDCRDRKTGSRCYRRAGFRWHCLLGLVPQARANQTESGGRQQQQPRGKAAKGGPARITAGAAGAQGSCRGERQTCGVSPRSAKTRS